MVILNKSSYQVKAEVMSDPRAEEAILTDRTMEYVSPINFEELHSLNQDVIGWLNINETVINYPILFNGTDEYLYQDINHKKSQQGSIYIDRKSKNLLNDNLTIIYGHNMRNGSMFASIDKYSNRDYWTSHQSIAIYTKSEKKEYLPYLCVVGPSDGVIRNVNDRESLIKFSREKRITQGMIPKEFPPTIVLITCNYTGDDYRTYLFCRLQE